MRRLPRQARDKPNETELIKNAAVLLSFLPCQGTCSSDTSYSSGLGLSPTSAHNEVYTFTSADHVYNYSAAIIKVVKLRESMRGYVGKLFDACKSSKSKSRQQHRHRSSR